jgi:hypothetical protein
MDVLSAGLTHDRSENQDKNEHFHCESLRVRHPNCPRFYRV